MIAYILIYTFLASLLAAITFVIGIPWSISKPRKDNQENSHNNISKTHR